MSVNVLKGHSLEKHQATLIKMAQRKELSDRLDGLTRATLNSYLRGNAVGADYKYREFRVSGYPVDDIARLYPDTALAVIDIVEEIKEGIEAEYQGKLQARGPIRRALGLAPFKLALKFVTNEAHLVAAEMERIQAKMHAAYGRKVMRRLTIKVDVIEKPIYISPRHQLLALEGSSK